MLRANGSFNSKQKLATSLKTIFKTGQFNESRLLFAGLNLKAIVQRKDKCTSMDGAFKNKEH